MVISHEKNIRKKTQKEHKFILRNLKLRNVHVSCMQYKVHIISYDS